MSIINDALKKAAKKSKIVETISETSKEMIERLQPDFHKRRWERKKQMLFAGISGSLLAGVTVLTVFFTKGVIAYNPEPSPDSAGSEITAIAKPRPEEMQLSVPPAVADKPAENPDTEEAELPDEKKDSEFVKLPELALNGIINGRGRPYAIINNRILDIGSNVRGATVVSISHKSVSLVYDDQEFILRLK